MPGNSLVHVPGNRLEHHSGNWLVHNGGNRVVHDGGNSAAKLTIRVVMSPFAMRYFATSTLMVKLGTLLAYGICQTFTTSYLHASTSGAYSVLPHSSKSPKHFYFRLHHSAGGYIRPF